MYPINRPERLAVIVSALALVAGGTLLVFLPNDFYGMGLAAFGALLLAYRKEITRAGTVQTEMAQRKLGWILLAVYIALLVYILMILSSALYIRPFEYFVAASVLLWIPFATTLTADARYARILALSQLTVGALVVRLGLPFVYGTSVGVDAWFHVAFANEIAKYGYVPTGSRYSYFPLMQIATAIAMEIMGIESRWIAFLLTAFIGAMGILTVYVLTHRFIGWQASLFGATLLAVEPANLNFGQNPTPMSFGFFVIPLLVLAAARIRRDRIWLPLASLLAIFAVLSNVLLSMVTVAFLVLMLLSDRFYRTPDSSFVTSTRFVLAVILMTAMWWSLVAIWALPAAVLGLSLPRYMVPSRFNMPIQFWLFTNWPECMFYAFGFVGLFKILFVDRHSRFQSYVKYATSTVLLGEGLVAASVRSLIPYRWSALGKVSFSQVSGYGILALMQNRRRTILLILLFLQVFSSLTNYVSLAWDAGLAPVPANYRYALTKSEQDAAQFALSHARIWTSDYYVAYATDPFYVQSLTRSEVHVRSFTLADVQDRLASDTALALVRAYTLSSVVFTEEDGFVPLEPNTGESLIASSDRVYDDSGAMLYFQYAWRE